MQIAIVAAGFTPDEADKLRRAMATFRHTGTIHLFRAKFIGGMVANGYAREFAERCFGQIEGFGEYGFPESHAASFALLVYVSSWLKRYYPEAFCAALLNSQPMGFYAPAQLVRDAREHGVAVLHPDVNRSDWDCTLETAATGSPPPCGEGLGVGVVTSDAPVAIPPPGASRHPPRKGEGKSAAVAREATHCAVRLGLRLVDGLAEAPTRQIVAARGAGYASVGAVWLRSGAPVSVLESLADADAFRSTGLDRRAALWAVKGLDGGALLAGARRATAAASPILAWPGNQLLSADLFDERPVDLPSASLSASTWWPTTPPSAFPQGAPVAFFRESCAPAASSPAPSIGMSASPAGA
jgi:error-prone DNA polymerase